jgi:hypothetical protein
MNDVRTTKPKDCQYNIIAPKVGLIEVKKKRHRPAESHNKKGLFDGKDHLFFFLFAAAAFRFRDRANIGKACATVFPFSLHR